jgi:hypothetical protein
VGDHRVVAGRDGQAGGSQEAASSSQQAAGCLMRLLLLRATIEWSLASAWNWNLEPFAPWQKATEKS